MKKCKIFICVGILGTITSQIQASYLHSADSDFSKKKIITQRVKQTRHRISDCTKLFKIYFIDSKKINFRTNNQKNLTR